MKGALGVKARWRNVMHGVSGCSIIHLLKFIRHQLCAKCFSIPDALWSHCEIVEICRVQIA